MASSGSPARRCGVAPLLCPVHRSRRWQMESRSMVRGESPGPAPAAHARAQLAAHPVELTDMPPPEAAQEGAQGGWRLDHAAENTDRPTSTQRISVVDEVAARQRGSERQQFVPRVRPPRCAAEVEVMVDEFPQAQVLCKGGPSRPALATRRWSSKTTHTVGRVLWQHLLGAPCFRAAFCFKTILPDSEEHPLASSRTVPKVVFRWIRA